MGKAHKPKGYKLENTISKKSFLEFRKILGMPQIEKAHDNTNSMKIQALHINIDDDIKWINSYKPTPEVKLQNYLIQCKTNDQSIISSLNKIDRFLNQQGRVKSKAQSKEDEKHKKQNSQSTEVQYSNKIA